MANPHLANPKIAKVLLVDDASINREILRNHLESSVAFIDEAGGGVEALELFKQTRYDAVLLDIEMPGMDGYDTLRALRTWEREHALHPAIVLAVTTSDFPGDEERVLAAGATAYLAKPVKKQKLMAALGIKQPGLPDSHPMANLLPQLFTYAEKILNEIESDGLEDTNVASKKLHELRGALASFCFQDLAERLKQIHLLVQGGENLSPGMFEDLRRELRATACKALSHTPSDQDQKGEAPSSRKSN